jgi:hypothetical protein
MLPRGFILGVVTSLNFAHSDNLVVSHSLGGIQNFDWPFSVGQITAKVELYHWQLLFWPS